MQEFKEERKQNVRFADIVTKPINIHFSKSDSDEDSNTNVRDPLSIAIPINSIVLRQFKKKTETVGQLYFQTICYTIILFECHESNFVHTITTVLSC